MQPFAVVLVLKQSEGSGSGGRSGKQWYSVEYILILDKLIEVVVLLLRE